MISEGQQAGDAYLRVVLAEPGRAGLGDLVRDKLPNALEVMLDDAHRPRPGARDGERPSRVGRSPVELFSDYLTERNINDPRISALFAELLDEVTGASGDAAESRRCDPWGGVMRPVRLLLDGFGCYRAGRRGRLLRRGFLCPGRADRVGEEHADRRAVFRAVRHRSSVGQGERASPRRSPRQPTHAGCCLVFEAAGKRYGAVRALTRDKRGQVHTKEARLELLDPEIPPDAPIAEILAASIDQLAEGPDLVKARVQEILGLTYEHFTQSVLLPQGQFSEFLHAKASARQDLLVELLAFGVYNKVGQLARKRAELANDRMRIAQTARTQLADATEEAESRAATRVMELTDLARIVEEKLQSLGQLKEQAERAAQQAGEVRKETGLLAAVQIPAEVPGLAQRISEADQLLAGRRKQRDAADEAEAQAQQAREVLPDRTRMEMLRKAYEDRRDLIMQLEQQERALAEKQADQHKASSESPSGRTRTSAGAG